MVPNECEPEVVDIVDRLLRLVPEDRLGAGPPGSENDYEALKNHPFFKGINFDKLDSTSPPIPADRYASFFKAFKGSGKPRDTFGIPVDKPQSQYFVGQGSDESLPGMEYSSEPKIDASAAKMNS